MDTKEGFHKTKHEACPKCRVRGADTRGDNLARYPDGHAYCFSCGHYEPPDRERQLHALLRAAPEWRRNELEADDSFLNFPTDFDRYLPKVVSEWLKKYGITSKEIISNRFGWSEERQMLIMPIFDKDDKLEMWQGRYFGNNPNFKLKYLTKGPKSDIVHIIWPANYSLVNEEVYGKGAKVILVEGLIDAIKVGRVFPAVPLWGSKAPLQLLRKLSKQFSSMGVWLDPDMTAESLRTAIRASQFIQASVITTVHDPKYYMDHLIAWIVDQGTVEKIS